MAGKRVLLAGAILALGMAITAIAQEGLGQRIGERIDQGVNRVGNAISQTWQEIREGGNRMSVEARLYARLHWDKRLENATLDFELQDGGVAVLKGAVMDSAAKAKAVELAQDTVGVNRVVDQLAIAPPAPPAR